MRARGTKQRWKSAKALQEEIESYFDSCGTEGKYPTVTGLALALGLTGRSELQRYLEGEAGELESRYANVLTRACSRVEEANIQAAYTREAASGARFLLQNGFGYSDKQEVGFAGKSITVRLTDDGEA